MMNWIKFHQVISTLVGYWIFSSMVSALPSPDDKSGKGYKFLFAFAHGLAANVMRIPQVRSFLGAEQPDSKEN